MMMEDNRDMALPSERAVVNGAASVSALRASVPSAEIPLRDEMISAVYQYQSDLRHPPAPDSVQRRLAWIEKIIARIQQEALA